MIFMVFFLPILLIIYQSGHIFAVMYNTFALFMGKLLACICKMLIYVCHKALLLLQNNKLITYVDIIKSFISKYLLFYEFRNIDFPVLVMVYQHIWLIVLKQERFLCQKCHHNRYSLVAYSPNASYWADRVIANIWWITE